MKTSELTGAALDWAVAQATHLHVTIQEGEVFDTALLEMDVDSGTEFTPSTDWAQGGPIIEREKISTDWAYRMEWDARLYVPDEEPWVMVGPTALIAAMRAFVASKLGDEVEIPKELL